MTTKYARKSIASTGSQCCQHVASYCELPAVAGRIYCDLHTLTAGGSAAGSGVSAVSQYCACSVSECCVPARRGDRPPLCPLHCVQLTSRVSTSSTRQPSSSEPAVTSSGHSWKLARNLLDKRDGFESSDDETTIVHRPYESDDIDEDDEDVDWAMEQHYISGLAVTDSSADFLRTAGVLTDEEVVQQAVVSCSHLRRLYVQQMGHIEQKLRQRRRQLLLDLNNASTAGFDGDASTSSCAASSSPISAHLKRRKERAYGRYQRPAGRDHLLWYKRCGRRAHMDGAKLQSSHPVCCHMNGSWRCSHRPLPLSRYCVQHVTLDARQQLFAVCCQTECSSVVARAPVCGGQKCWCQLHWPAPSAPPVVSVPEVCVDPFQRLEATLDDDQRRLVADIANTLMASAGALNTAQFSSAPVSSIEVQTPAAVDQSSPATSEQQM